MRTEEREKREEGGKRETRGEGRKEKERRETRTERKRFIYRIPWGSSWSIAFIFLFLLSRQSLADGCTPSSLGTNECFFSYTLCTQSGKQPYECAQRYYSCISADLCIPPAPCNCFNYPLQNVGAYIQQTSTCEDATCCEPLVYLDNCIQIDHLCPGCEYKGCLGFCLQDLLAARDICVSIVTRIYS